MFQYDKVTLIFVQLNMCISGSSILLIMVDGDASLWLMVALSWFMVVPWNHSEMHSDKGSCEFGTMFFTSLKKQNDFCAKKSQLPMYM